MLYTLEIHNTFLLLKIILQYIIYTVVKVHFFFYLLAVLTFFEQRNRYKICNENEQQILYTVEGRKKNYFIFLGLEYLTI